MILMKRRKDTKGLFRCVKEGDLVTIRLGETGTSRFLFPGLVVTKRRENKRDQYLILAAGETHWVTDNDLGPIELSLRAERKRRERSSGKA